ncbi:MAG: amidohydrolase family protein [Rhodospirillales bacterium]|nr:amidohydrolase family protein [Rhodospirillales bacterium]
MNGTLIDGTGAPPAQLRWLAIVDGRIAEVVCGPANDSRPLPPNANILFDARDRTVMPGIVDSHCHISYGVARGMEEQDLYASAEYRAIRGMWHAGEVLRSGVTSICDPGGSWNVAIAVRDAIKAGMFEGPRIAAAARYLTSHTGLADYYPTWIGAPRSGVGALTNDVQSMLTEVRAQAKNGVDLVKIAASGESSILSPGGGSVPAFRCDELRIIVDEAHRLGKRVTAHARSGQAIVDCIDAGVDWLQHGDFMTREQVGKLADSGIPLCPALTLNVNIAQWGHLAGCSQARIDRIKRDLDNSTEILSYAHRQGVRMMCGTDSGFAVTPYGEWHAREMELFVSHLGMSPLQAISCGTKEAAFAVDPEGVGSLEKGRWADVLIINGDPLQDIRILQDKARIDAVFKGGAPIGLDRRANAIRWPWEKSLEISHGELRYEMVYGAR